MSGATVLNFRGLSLNILRAILIGSACVERCALWTIGWRGCDGGSMQRCTAALWQMRKRVSSMGKRPVWASRRSVGVDFIPPIILKLAALCSFTICRRTPTDLTLLLWPSGLVGGVYQMSST